MMGTARKLKAKQFEGLVGVAEWAELKGLPAEHFGAFESHLLERSRYLELPYVRRTDATGAVCMVFPQWAMEANWTLLAGRKELPGTELDRVIRSLKVLTELKALPECLTFRQFVMAAKEPSLIARTHELELQVEQKSFDWDDIGHPMEFLAYDLRTGLVVRDAMLPRSLMIALLHGDLEH